MSKVTFWIRLSPPLVGAKAGAGLLRTMIPIAIWLGALAGLVSCTGGPGDAADAVQRYIEAKAAGDAETIGRLLCSQMEADLEREQLTFAGISEVRVEGMACAQEGDRPIVRCQGEIVALYGAEETEFPLVSYRVIEEDGEWKWCGEAP